MQWSRYIKESMLSFRRLEKELREKILFVFQDHCETALVTKNCTFYVNHVSNSISLEGRISRCLCIRIF